jgi:RNA polymerase sigma factor (sigma-70 family)
MQVKRSSVLPENGRTMADLSALSTPELVALAQAGNRDAFDPLYRRYGRRVLTYAQHLCDGDLALAEDIAADVWVKTMTRIDTWRARGRDDDDLVRWLFGLVRGALVEARRARWSEPPTRSRGDWHDAEWLAASERDADDWIESPDKQEMTDRLHAEIERLSPTCRAIVRLRLDGADCAEIGEVTGLSSKQAGDAWRRAQIDLRRRLVGRIDVDTLTEQDRAQLQELAQELPPVSREVALLRLAGTPMPEVATTTGMTRTQAHNAWRHAEDLLRKLQNDPQAARRPAVGRVATWQKEQDRLREAAQQLTPATRRVALLRLAGMTHPEIAEQTGRSVGTVASAWKRALDSFTRTGHLPAAA